MMRVVTQGLASSNARYQWCAALQVTLRGVPWPEMRDHEAAIRKVVETLPPRADDTNPYRSRLLHLLRHLRWLFTQSVLSPGQIMSLVLPDRREFDRLLDRTLSCYRGHPPIVGALEALATTSKTLLQMPASPLLSAVVELAREDECKHVGTLCVDESVLQASREALLEERLSADLVLIDPTRPRAGSVGSSLVVLGAPMLYPARLTQAPVWTRLRFAFPEHVRHELPACQMIEGAAGQPVHIVVKHIQTSRAAESLPAAESVTPDEPIDIDDLTGSQQERIQPNKQIAPGSDDDKVEARFFHLAGNRGIFLGHHDSVRIIELAETARPVSPQVETGFAAREGSFWFGRVAVEDLEPGMFLIDRGTSSDDALDAAIESVIGKEDRERMLSIESEWKEMLLHHISTGSNLDRMVRELHGRGCRSASEGNIRSWAGGDRHIPSDRQCFELMLASIGFSAEQIEQYWRNGKALRSLGLRAGFRISTWLRRAVDETRLREEGYHEVKIESLPDTLLCLLRIESCNRGQFLVPRRRLRHVEQHVYRLGVDLAR